MRKVIMRRSRKYKAPRVRYTEPWAIGCLALLPIIGAIFYFTVALPYAEVAFAEEWAANAANAAKEPWWLPYAIFIPLLSMIYGALYAEWLDTKAALKKVKEWKDSGQTIMYYDYARRHWYPEGK